MSSNAVGPSSSRRSARGARRGWHLLAALTVVAGAACDGEEVVGPPATGSLDVAVETTGFMKDDGYELFVNGESQGTVAAAAEFTLEEVEPGTYEVSLGDVAANCSVDAASVEVVADQTAALTLTVDCSYETPAEYTLRFSRDRPNLENGEITQCSFGLCPSEEFWDMWMYYDSQSDPHAVVRQNQTTGVEIAHLPGVTLATLTEADVDGATFTTELVADVFGPDRVVLVRSDTGKVYALGNPVEDDLAQTVTFDAALILQ